MQFRRSAGLNKKRHDPVSVPVENQQILNTIEIHIQVHKLAAIHSTGKRKKQCISVITDYRYTIAPCIIMDN
jgi:hypothetical protein